MARILIDTYGVAAACLLPTSSSQASPWSMAVRCGISEIIFKVMEDFGGPSQRDLAPRSI
jgi:hypothetical protein